MKHVIRFTLVTVALLLALLACQNELSGTGDVWDPNLGRLTVSINSGVQATSTIAPDLAMVIDEYDVTLVDPDGVSTTHELGNATSRTFVGLTPGEWTITVEGYEGTGSDRVRIGSGSVGRTVLAGQRVTAPVEVVQLPGSGTLELVVTWPEDAFEDPQIIATLSPVDDDGIDEGNEVTLSFNISDNRADLVAADQEWDVGYYALSIQLQDEGAVAWRPRAFSVRIVADQVSRREFDLSETDITTGTLDVTITSNLSNPYVVGFDWTPPEKEISTGDSITATVTLDPNVAPDEVLWYLDGERQQGQSGTAITLSGLDEGTYWLDALVRHGAILSSHGDSFIVSTD